MTRLAHISQKMAQTAMVSILALSFIACEKRSEVALGGFDKDREYQSSRCDSAAQCSEATVHFDTDGRGWFSDEIEQVEFSYYFQDDYIRLIYANKKPNQIMDFKMYEGARLIIDDAGTEWKILSSIN